MSARNYIISARAKTAMENELRRFPDTETGGLLLGYADMLNGVVVMEATDSGYQNTIHEPCCFQYDNAYILHICTVLSELYTPPLDVVGIWHKHNSSCPIVFSQADECLHAQLVRQFAYPCLSVLFEKTSSEENNQIHYDIHIFELGISKHIDVSRMVKWQKVL